MSNLKETYGCFGTCLCKHCHSGRTRKYGLVEGVQTYFCNNCKRKFRVNASLFRMKTPYLQVTSALEEYYTGRSINNIRDRLSARFGNSPPSSKTVYGWVTKFSGEAVNQFKDYHPKVGSVWIIGESVLTVNGKNYWCLDIIDRYSRFLLATQLSISRDTMDIKNLLDHAVDRADKNPDQVLIGSWNGYREGLDLAFGSCSKRISVELIGENDHIEFLEHWYSTVKSRTKTLKRLKSIETACKFLEGFRICHNYLRPQESFDGKTPAEKAEVHYTSKSWSDVLRVVNLISSTKATR
jgi:putative transposase